MSRLIFNPQLETMSLSPQEIENVIGSRFGQLSKDGEPFSAEYLSSFVEKMRQFDAEKKAREERELQESFAKKRKPGLICPNPECRETDEDNFEKDERVAQLTCKRCGSVIAERQIHDGEWVRKFEGEVNPSFHGAPPDLKFSSARNLRTGFAEIPGKKKQARDLSLAQQSVELNLSSMMDNTKERRTRVGYKDNDKEKIFESMNEINESIQLHQTILDRAQTIFAKYRDDVEQLNNRFEIAAACMILAFREKLEEEGETKVRAGSNVPVPDKEVEAQLEFRCKYCDFPFSLKRDRTFHQKVCEDRPKDASSTSSNGNEHGEKDTKRIRLG